MIWGRCPDCRYRSRRHGSRGWLPHLTVAAATPLPGALPFGDQVDDTTPVPLPAAVWLRGAD
jgi:hypothetical protein